MPDAKTMAFVHQAYRAKLWETSGSVMQACEPADCGRLAGVIAPYSGPHLPMPLREYHVMRSARAELVDRLHRALRGSRLSAADDKSAERADTRLYGRVMQRPRTNFVTAHLNRRMV